MTYGFYTAEQEAEMQADKHACYLRHRQKTIEHHVGRLMRTPLRPDRTKYMAKLKDELGNAGKQLFNEIEIEFTAKWREKNAESKANRKPQARRSKASHQGGCRY